MVRLPGPSSATQRLLVTLPSATRPRQRTDDGPARRSIDRATRSSVHLLRQGTAGRSKWTGSSTGG
eukprot:9109555-Alexandrium_andersonii.AAC.1